MEKHMQGVQMTPKKVRKALPLLPSLQTFFCSF